MLSKSKLKKLREKWYSRDEVAEIILQWVQNREVMGRKMNEKVERPLPLMSPADIRNLEEIISFHATQETFDIDVNLETSEDKVANVVAYDFTIDIDCNTEEKNLKIDPLELSKDVAIIVCEFLQDLGIKPLVKFSGRRGFHIILQKFMTNEDDLFEYRYFVHKAFIMLINTIIQSYLPYLAEKYGVGGKDIQSLREVVVVDIQIASPRHMVRVPLSLHEKTGLVAVVLYPKELKDFTTDMAEVDNAEVPSKLEYEIPEDAKRKILLLSLAVMYKYMLSQEYERKTLFFYLYKPSRRSIKIDIKNITEDDLLPPCVRKLLQGVSVGMRNNTLFFLIHFFKKLGKSFDEIQKIVYDWNERNEEPLKDKEIDYALRYHWEHNYMPYSCKKVREIFGNNYCQPDEFCSDIKNPIQYPYRKLKYIKRIKKLVEGEGQQQ